MPPFIHFLSEVCVDQTKNSVCMKLCKWNHHILNSSKNGLRAVYTAKSICFPILVLLYWHSYPSKFPCADKPYSRNQYVTFPSPFSELLKKSRTGIEMLFYHYDVQITPWYFVSIREPHIMDLHFKHPEVWRAFVSMVLFQPRKMEAICKNQSQVWISNPRGWGGVGWSIWTLVHL